MSATQVKDFRKKLASLWGVELFRVELENGRILVDGKPPTEEQQAVFEQDVKSAVASHIGSLN